MERSIYFHLGTVKTGSTFIQKTAWEQRDYLASQDLCYLQVSPPQLNLPRYANADFIWEEDNYEHAKDVIERTPQSRILISEEGLMGRPASMFLPIFDGFDLHAIIYVRPPADLVAAWAAEKAMPYNAATHLIRDQSGLQNIEDGLYNLASGYKFCMNAVFASFEGMNKSNINIRPFETEQFKNKNLLDDFFSSLGVDVPSGISDVVNATRSRKFYDISSMVWAVARGSGLNNNYSHSIVEWVVEKCQTGDDRPVIETIEDKLIEELSDMLRFIEDDISSKFLGGSPLFYNRMPECYGKNRLPHQPPDFREVEYLALSALQGSIVGEGM